VKTIFLPKTNAACAYRDEGQGLAVMWLHAFPLDGEMWQPQLAALSAAGYRGLAIDLPGFGASTALPGWTIDSAADAIAELLLQLQIPAVVLGGESMGGYIALAFARRHPQQLAGLILADTRAAADDAAARKRREKMIEDLRQQGAAVVVDNLLSQLVSDHTRRRQPELVEQIRRMALRQTPDALIDALLALRDRPDASPHLSAIRVPTLVLVGEHDTITPPLAAARLAGSIHSAQLQYIPEAGHLSNLENPQAFNSAVLEFLQRLR
jgi:pimeloyl-ACP methyl ester carboxylesterase